MAAKKDLVGQVFGRLTVVKESDRHTYPSGRKARMWECVCECGNSDSVRVFQKALTSGNTKSCGCFSEETRGKYRITHGLSQSRPYKIWVGMKRRCDTEEGTNWARYGGRGITYDTKWKTFEGFWEDMKEGYEDNLTIDREDNNGNYCKSNCRWATPKKQTRNKGKSSRNTSGVTGVGLNTKGNGKTYWKAQWYDPNGRIRAKYFSIKTLGWEGAFKSACEFRKMKILGMNQQGAGYTEGHGI